MKSLLVLVASLVSVMALAQEAAVVSHKFGYSLPGEARNSNVFGAVKISVDSDGLATIINFRVDRFRQTEKALSSLTKKLAPSTKKAILTRAQRLTSVKVVTVRRDRVCTLMPSPVQRLNELSVLDTKSESLRLVMGPTGCWLKSVTRPELQEDYDLGNDLKTRLRTIAENELGL